MEANPQAVVERFPRLNVANQGPLTRCKNCTHWFKNPPDAKAAADLRAPVTGTCKLNPPQLFCVGMAQGPGGNTPIMIAGIVSTQEEDFCGQHEPRLSKNVQ
jgi:hypothetical protein